MRQLLYITILLSYIILSKSAHINNTNVNKTETFTVEEIDDANNTVIQIETLQKEKEDLFNKINKAIDETIPVLEKSNDTEAPTGVEHLKKLKQQIKEIHEATDSDDDFRNSSDVNSTEFRRKLSISIDRAGKESDWFKNFKKDEFYSKLLKSKDKKYTSLPRVWNRQKIAEQIQLWLAKQQEEKKKLKELKLKMKIDLERCPDYGRGKEKKKTRGSKKSKSHYFPCCRKCCKKSYLGCL